MTHPLWDSQLFVHHQPGTSSTSDPSRLPPPSRSKTPRRSGCPSREVPELPPFTVSDSRPPTVVVVGLPTDSGPPTLYPILPIYLLPSSRGVRGRKREGYGPGPGDVGRRGVREKRSGRVSTSDTGGFSRGPRRRNLLERIGATRWYVT